MHLTSYNVIEHCVRFTQALREKGVNIGSSKDFIMGISELNPMDRRDIYWAGRSTLCSSPDDVSIYDALFAEWFESQISDNEEEYSTTTTSTVENSNLPTEDDNEVIYAASKEEVLQHRDFATLTPAEEHRISQLFKKIPVELPHRRSRRSRRWHRGEVDIRRIVRDQLRNGGDVALIRHRRPQTKARRLVFLIDISRSMSPYSDQMLRLTHHVRSVEPEAVEVFTMGTRLTRVSRALAARNPEEALAAVGRDVQDWSGGTRIADGINAFLDGWGQRRAARQAIVVIMSDGWERGDTAALANSAQQLKRLAHTMIWVNPHSGKVEYEPIQQGVLAVLPSVDHFLAGHTMNTFYELMEVIRDV